MDKKDKILKLYYDENLKMVEIANRIGVSKQYVSKIIKKDDRYQYKKEKLKQESKIRKNQYTNRKVKELREEKNRIEAEVKQKHLQATRELSSGYPIINNRAFRKWNASAYKYNKRKDCFEFDKKLIRSYAIPKYVK